MAASVHRLVACLCLRRTVGRGRKASQRLGVYAHRDGREDCVPPAAPESGDGPPPAPRPASGAACRSRACPMPRPASVLHGLAGEARRGGAGPRLRRPPLPTRQPLGNPSQPTHSRRQANPLIALLLPVGDGVDRADPNVARATKKSGVGGDQPQESAVRERGTDRGGSSLCRRSIPRAPQPGWKGRAKASKKVAEMRSKTHRPRDTAPSKPVGGSRAETNPRNGKATRQTAKRLGPHA